MVNVLANGITGDKEQISISGKYRKKTNMEVQLREEKFVFLPERLHYSKRKASIQNGLIKNWSTELVLLFKNKSLK